MASYSFLAPRPTNAILSDVDHIREIQWILAQLNPSLADDAPEDSKRLVPLDSAKTQYRFERLVGSSWNSVGKLMHDVDTLDGYHASISAVKNTIPVYNADAKLVGDLTGNANTATTLKNIRKLQIGGIASGGSVNFDGSADATIEITQLTVNNANDTAINGILTVKHGGTGGADAATARANLGVPAIDHSSTAKTFGVASTTKYGHAIGSDTPNSTFTADKGYFFSPKGANDLDSALRALIAQEAAKCLKTSGGDMQGTLSLLGTWGDFLGKTGGAIGDNGGCLRLTGGPFKASDSGAYIHLHAKEHASKPGWIELISQNGSTSTTYVIKPDGTFTKSGKDILTSGGGTLTGALRIAYGSQIQGTDDTASLNIFGGAGFAHGGQLTLVGMNASFLPGGFRLGARNAEKVIWLDGDINGNLKWNSNAVLTSAGGTLTGVIYGSGGVLRGKSSADNIWVCGGDASSNSAYIQLNGGTYSSMPGGITFQPMKPSGRGKPLILAFDSLKYDGSAVLTSAGGTLTGALRIAYGSQIQHDVDYSYLALYGGAGYQHGAQLALIGKDASWLPGGFQLAAQDAEKAVCLNGDIDGNLTWDGYAVWTSFNGNVVNSKTVAVGNVTGNTFTLPAGGTWAYTYHRNTYGDNAGGSGTAAGGTTITAKEGPTSYFAIRIA